MLVVAGLSLKNLEPRVWDPRSPYYLPSLKAVMVSYGEFHQLPWRRRAAMKEGLRKYLDVPAHIRVYLDNGAFYFLRNQGEADQRRYREFIRKAKPDWYPVRFDAIPTPEMAIRKQRLCFERTMSINRSFQHDGFVPVIHVSRMLECYIDELKKNARLAGKTHLAIGGIVPNLLRSPRAMAYDTLLDSLRRVRNEFPDKTLHVFGIGGTATLHVAALLGMDSVDSSGWRNRAARGIIQLPGSGDRSVAKFGNWRGRSLSEAENEKLGKCRCPACQRFGINGLQGSGLSGFCNRAAHNLHVLLQEEKWIERKLSAQTYGQHFRKRLDNSAYLSLIEKLIVGQNRESFPTQSCRND